jgi:hypothetical protein
VVLLTWNVFSWTFNLYISPNLKHISLNSCTKFQVLRAVLQFNEDCWGWCEHKKKTIAVSKVRGQWSCQPHWIVASAWYYPSRIHKFMPVKIEVSLSWNIFTKKNLYTFLCITYASIFYSENLWKILLQNHIINFKYISLGYLTIFRLWTIQLTWRDLIPLLKLTSWPSFVFTIQAISFYLTNGNDAQFIIDMNNLGRNSF